MNRVILYHALLPAPVPGGRPALGPLPHWTGELAYARRTTLPVDPAARARSLLGIALALRALGQLLGRVVGAAELVFETDRKPRLRASDLHACPDFSIAHAGRHVAVALRGEGCIGLDLEDNGDAANPTLGARLSSWIAREAVLKAAGLGLRDSKRVALQADGSASLDGRPFQLRELHFAPDCQVCVASDAGLAQIDIHAESAADVAALLCSA
jgi:phosphopantetheinyl transferase